MAKDEKASTSKEMTPPASEVMDIIRTSASPDAQGTR
jgi:hypothetical protein